MYLASLVWALYFLEESMSMSLYFPAIWRMFVGCHSSVRSC